LIVHVVVNVEHWPFDRTMPRHILSPPGGAVHVPDVPNFSWVEYGLRCGLPRILRFLARHAIPFSAAVNSSIATAYPECLAALCEAGCEFIGHGTIQQPLPLAEDEPSIIRRTLDELAEATGQAVRGWLGPGLAETNRTPDILAQLGVEYVCDWFVDDLPCWMRTKKGRLLALPYALDLNDVVIFAIEKHPSAELPRRVQDTIAVFEREFDQGPRILTLALHPHIVGVPHRFFHLERTLADLAARDDTLFMTGGGIADWYVSASSASGAMRPQRS
jgi:peptidoglycan/xylan/chitin deacetylase (PgdA/CDA1 family)